MVGVYTNHVELMKNAFVDKELYVSHTYVIYIHEYCRSQHLIQVYRVCTSAMLSIFGRAGATPLVVVERPHALSCVL